MSTKTFRLTQVHRATGDMGAVRTVDVETVTQEGDGVRVNTRVTGTVEGTIIDRGSSHFYRGVTMASATEYRLRHGYVIVGGVTP